MADQVIFAPMRALDRNGNPVASAQARFFLSGTTTAATVYADQGGTTPHPTPLVADGRGMFPQVFSTQALKVEVRDTLGAMLPGYPVDPIFSAPTEDRGGSSIAFVPTDDIPETNVQDAIERVQANIGAGLSDIGFGATGSVAILSNLNATTTASGAYRVTAATTGTFPANMLAADGGILVFMRETASAASMTLMHGTTERRATRDMVAGVWGGWREEMTVNQTLAAGDTTYHNGTNFARLPKGTAGATYRMNAGATAPEWSTDFTSAEQVIPGGGVVTVAHGLGAVPSQFGAVFRCITAQAPYAIGDEVEVSGYVTSGASYGATVTANATSVVVRTASAARVYIHDDAGSYSVLDPTKWRIVARASK